MSEGCVICTAGRPRRLELTPVLDRLRSVEDDHVRLGRVHSDEWNFILFVDRDELVVRSCLAVDAALANPNWDWSTLQY